MKIGVVGAGFVGGAMARAFMEHAEIRVHDVLPDRSMNTLAEVLECDFVFVCLPTPMQDAKEGVYRPDLTYLHGFFGSIEGSKTRLILKSTVPVGTTEQMAKQYWLPNLVHSPEFLTARCANIDAQTPARNIVGYTSEEGSKKTADEFGEVLKKRFPGIQLFVMRSNATELVKLMCNNFFAVKVAFFNEMFRFVEHLGGEENGIVWDELLGAVLADGRIAHAHTKVPGPDGKFGFGGTCLPKDLKNTITHMQALGMEPSVLQGAWLRNFAERKLDF